MSAAEDLTEALWRQGAAQPFDHDAVIFGEGVPREIVRIYAGMRLTKAAGEAILMAIVVERAGPGSTIPGDDPKNWPMMWRVARAYAARCADLERRLRGQPERAA